MLLTDFLSLLRSGLTITALDVDNALYMTSVLDESPPRDQRRILFCASVGVMRKSSEEMSN